MSQPAQPAQTVVVEENTSHSHDHPGRKSRFLLPAAILEFIFSSITLGLAGGLLHSLRKDVAPPEKYITNPLTGEILETHLISLMHQKFLLISLIICASLTLIYSIVAMFFRRFRGGAGTLLMTWLTVILMSWWAVNMVMLAVQFHEAIELKSYTTRNAPALPWTPPERIWSWLPDIQDRAIELNVGKRDVVPNLPLQTGIVIGLLNEHDWVYSLVHGFFGLQRDLLTKIVVYTGILTVFSGLTWLVFALSVLSLLRAASQHRHHGSLRDMIHRVEEGRVARQAATPAKPPPATTKEEVVVTPAPKPARA